MIRNKQLKIDQDLEVNGYQLKNAIVEIVANVGAAFIDEGRFSYATDTKILYVGDGTTAQQVGSIPTLENINTINFNTSYTILGTEADGTIYWNGDYHTLEYKNGLYTFRLGQTEYFVFYNDTGVTINAFKVLHLKSAALFNGILYPTFELADASKWELTQGTLIVTCKDVLNGELGVGVMRAQEITGGSTSSITAGSQLWLSDDGSGSITDTKPSFPSYAISIGGNYNQVAAPNGKILVNITKDIYDTYGDAWDGAVRESFNFTVSSNGTVVTGLLENVDNTKNLTVLFSDGFYTLDTTTVPLTVTLTAGTDSATTSNYVYIPIGTKVLTVSTTGFPATEHAKIARLEVQSAASVQALGGARRNQNINDHIKQEDDNGHILHISERIRQLNSQWDNGTEASLTGTTVNGYIQVTSGQVWQLHLQAVPAFSMPTDSILVINDSVTPYRSTTNLNTITAYSDGTSWSNEWANIVIWGIANKTGEPGVIMCNLPSAGYNSEENAVADALNYTDYAIPEKYRGVGFLIGRFTIRISGGAITYNSGVGYLDLRGFVPNNVAGGGGGGSGVTSFLGLDDTPIAYTGEAGKLVKVNDAENAVEFVHYELVEKTFPIQYASLNDLSSQYIDAQDAQLTEWLDNILFTETGVNYEIVTANLVTGTLDGTNNPSGVKVSIHKNAATIMSAVTALATGNNDLTTNINSSLNTFTKGDKVRLYVDTYAGSDAVPSAVVYVKLRRK